MSRLKPKMNDDDVSPANQSMRGRRVVGPSWAHRPAKGVEKSFTDCSMPAALATLGLSKASHESAGANHASLSFA